MPYPCRRALKALTFLLSFTILFPTLALSQPAAPSLVRDINPGLNPKDWWGSPQLFFDWKGVAYFYNIDSAHGAEMWRTDGTEEGTYLLKDILPGPLGSEAGSSRLAAGDSFYFSAFDRNFNFLPWKSDGTIAGTVQVKDVVPGLDYGSLLGKVGDNILLLVWNPEAGFEIWKTDGSEEGTLLVRDIVPGVVDGSIDNLTIANGLLFFSMMASTGWSSGRVTARPKGPPSSGTSSRARVPPHHGSGRRRREALLLGG